MIQYRLHKLMEVLDSPVGFTLIFLTVGPMVG